MTQIVWSQNVRAGGQLIVRSGDCIQLRLPKFVQSGVDDDVQYHHPSVQCQSTYQGWHYADDNIAHTGKEDVQSAMCTLLVGCVLWYQTDVKRMASARANLVIWALLAW